ncbi:MAG TPA: hypothetical protein VK669_00710 [Candidatus Limnocylindrales bacterium]|nr:hypothetical protein [Candidatus Limnocylindrales bacterium]
MNRITKTLALAAVVLAGAFGATAAQASAADFQVNFKVQNNDASVSMIRITDPLPTGVNGLIKPPSAIAAGGADPATGNATWTGQLPGLNTSVSVSLTYGRASDNGAQCTFTMKITHDTNSNPYLLEFSVSPSSPCAVPGPVRTSNGQFTAQTYALGWST